MEKKLISPYLLPMPKLRLFSEIKARRRNEILGGQARGRKPFPVKEERRLVVHVEQIIQQFQPILAIQRRGSHPQPLEAVEQIHLKCVPDAAWPALVFAVHPKGQVLALGQTIVALRQLLLKHLRCIRAG